MWVWSLWIGKGVVVDSEGLEFMDRPVRVWNLWIGEGVEVVDR